MLGMQTLNQYLQTLGGAASQHTALHTTMENQNIAGLYKQQQTDDRFKVGSPSGSVYWTQGEHPAPTGEGTVDTAELPPTGSMFQYCCFPLYNAVLQALGDIS